MGHDDRAFIRLCHVAMLDFVGGGREPRAQRLQRCVAGVGHGFETGACSLLHDGKMLCRRLASNMQLKSFLLENCIVNPILGRLDNGVCSSLAGLTARAQPH